MALEICREVVRRARSNLLRIRERLVDLGYEFAEPDSVLVDAGPEAVATLNSFETDFGKVPLFARAWYETFSSVNFTQAEHQLLFKESTASAAPDVFGLGFNPVLVTQSLEHARAQNRRMDAEWEESLLVDGINDWHQKFFPLGTYASNCDPKGFRLPCPAIDGVIYNDGGGDIYFVDQLRAAFEWGGFPFWQHALKNKKLLVPMTYRPNFERLLPLLKDGLIDL